MTVNGSLDGDSIRFQVIDDGLGCSMRDPDEPFELFRRLVPRDGRFPGVGAGLTIVRAVAQRHGGSAVLASEEGKGTTLTMTFPAPRDPS